MNVPHSTELWEQRKQQLRLRIDKKERDVRKALDTLREPDDNSTRQKRWMNSIGRSVALFDGVLTGYRLYKRLQRLLPAKGSKRRKK